MTLEEKIEELAATERRFAALAPELKKIAVDTALEVLGIADEDLALKAGEVDFLAVNDPFARFDRDLNGSVLKGHTDLREELLGQEKPNFEKINKYTNRRVREEIASRLSRIRLAHALGYTPGNAVQITDRDDFRTGEDLCTQAVRELQ